MNAWFKRFWQFWFPPSRWTQCKQLTNAERMAQYEIRLGHHKANECLRRARVEQALDARNVVRLKFTPKLPDSNVVPMRRRRKKA